MPAVAAKEPAVVHPNEVTTLHAPGITHEVAFEEALPPVPGQRVLVQRTYNEPGELSDWHVHPNYTTYGYQLTGQLLVEYGPAGSRKIECEAGDFVRIPASCIQREGAIGVTPRSGIGVRIGSGQPVVDLDGPDVPLPKIPPAPETASAAAAPVRNRPEVVREADLNRAETNGLLREIAFEEDLAPVADQHVVVERSHQEAGEASGWRTHPNYVKFAYQIAGQVRIEFGPGSDDFLEAGPGDFVSIPAGTVYREIAAPGAPSVTIAVRIGSGVSVVEADAPA
jgi:quercetin dioxygenase-like cupin family protein